jgi:hypothetical protein
MRLHDGTPESRSAFLISSLANQKDLVYLAVGSQLQIHLYRSSIIANVDNPIFPYRKALSKLCQMRTVSLTVALK